MEGRGRQISELKASLVNKVSSRTARPTQRNPDSKNKTKNKNTNNDFMKFTSKWMEPENLILSEVTQAQKNTHDIYSLISGY